MRCKTRRRGETGRRNRLKICRGRPRIGSIPIDGTKNPQGLQPLRVFDADRWNRKLFRFRARFRKGCELVSDGTPTETEAPERSEGIDGILSLPCLFACRGGIENSFDSARGFGKVASLSVTETQPKPKLPSAAKGSTALSLPCLFACRGGIENSFDSARGFGKVASLSVTETQPKPKLPSEAKGSTKGIENSFDSARGFGRVTSLSVIGTYPKPKLPSAAKGARMESKKLYIIM